MNNEELELHYLKYRDVQARWLESKNIEVNLLNIFQIFAIDCEDIKKLELPSLVEKFITSFAIDRFENCYIFKSTHVVMILNWINK